MTGDASSGIYLGELWQVLAFAAVLIIAGFFLARLDPDAGGYVDGFRTKATFPDKFVHFACAFGLTLAFALVEPAYAAAITVVLGGAAYERGQGYFSAYDLAADFFGAGVAWGLIHILTGVI